MALTVGLDIRKHADFGIGTYIQQLLKGLAGSVNAGLKVTVYAGQSQPLPEGMPDQWKVHVIRRYRRNPIQGIFTPLEADVYHAPHYITPRPSPGTPFILTVHDLIHLIPPRIPHFHKRFFPASYAIYDRTKRFYHKNLSSQLLTRRIREADHVIAVSQSTADQISWMQLKNMEDMTVIHNCIDPVFFEKPDQSEIGRFLLRISLPARQYFLYTGNDLMHKNLGGLLKAFSIYKSRKPNPHLLVLAGPPRSGMILKAAAGMGILEWVRCLPRLSREEISMLYREALAVVIPSFAEGFGLPVIEAMACGIPVLCSDIAVFHEITHETALFFDPYSPEDICNRLNQAAIDSNSQQKLAEQAYRNSLQFAPQRFIDRHVEVYRQLGNDP